MGGDLILESLAIGATAVLSAVYVVGEVHRLRSLRANARNSGVEATRHSDMTGSLPPPDHVDGASKEPATEP